MSVVRMRRQGGKIVQDADIYVGRSCTQGGWNLVSSKWANPFTIKQYGLDALIKYEQHIRETPSLWNDLEELDGKVLGCWCTFDNRKGKERLDTKKIIEICHAQVLLRLLEEKKMQIS